jgi:hypothetical protein
VNPCDAVIDALAEGSPLSGDLARHARECPRCRALTAADAALASMVTDAPDASETVALPAALRAAIERDHSPVAPFSWRRRALVPAAVSVALVGVSLALMPRGDLGHQPPLVFWSLVTLWAVCAFAGAGLALHRGGAGVGVAPWRRWAFLAAGLGLFELASATLGFVVEGSKTVSGRDAVVTAVACTVHGLVIAMVAGAAVFFVARRTAAASPASAGAMAGAAAGFTGALVQHVTCAIPEPSHTMVAHFATIALSALVGALAGRKLLVP